MKKLRHLLRRTGFKAPEARRQSSPVSGRRLRTETLEKRQLLAGDLALAHNYWHATDVDDNREITANDALRVINLLQRNNGSFEVTQPGQIDSFADVNADGMVTAGDALAVINSLNRGEAVGELVDMRLNARDVNDDPLTTDSNRSITVDVGETFYLELSYSDLRTFGADIGAFQISTDIQFSQPNVVTPVFTETQFLVVEDTIRTASSGEMTLSLAGGTETVTSTLGQFANDPEAEITRALTELGYDADDFEVTALATNLVLFPGQSTSPEPDPGNPSFEIRYTNFDDANVDLPDLVITPNFDVAVRTQSLSTPPVINGEINGAAAGDNLDTRSRSFPGVDPFGQLVYGSRKFGEFDPVDGFDELGVLGPALGGGIPERVGSFPEPFDAFSIPIQINQPVTDLTISLDLAESSEAVLLYGRDEGGVPPELILLNDLLSSITINAVGQATGVVAGDATETLDEDGAAVNVDLAALTTVNSGGDVTYAIVSNGSVGNATISGSTLTYTPTADAFGADSITYSATNSAGTDTGTVSLTVNPVNDPPVAANDTDTVDSGSSVTVDVLANDSFGPANEAQTLTISNIGIPANGTATASAGGIQYTPAAGFSGNDSFTYTISDGDLTAQATVSITVNAVSVGPTAADGTLSTTEDQAAPVTLDLSSLVTINSGDAAMITITTDPTLGTATLTGTTLSYTPGANNFGSDSLVYTATNNEGSDTGTIAITIDAVNDAPVAVDDSLSGTEGVVATINVLANDSAGPNETDSLTVQSVADGSNGTTSVNAAGNVEYTPNANFNGTDSFTYVVSDGALTATATVNVTIVAVNDPPVAGDDSATTNEDTAVVIPVLNNDNAGPGETDTLTVTGVTAASNGSAIVNANNTVTYTPDANFFGSDTFDYTLSDGESSTTGTVTVTVTAVNDAPVAVDDSATTQEDTAVNITVLANDNAGPGESDAISVVSVDTPSNGTATVSANGVVTYTPSSSFFGTDTFDYTISDGALTSTATITVTVTDVLNAPTAANGSASVDEDAGPVTVDLNALVQVDSGDTFTVAITNNGSRGTATLANGVLSYTPNADEFGTDTIVYTATNSVGSDSGTITISINAINDPPVLGLTSGSVLKDSSLVLDVLANASSGADNELDTLLIDGVTDPNSGSVSVSGGVITYTPDTGFVGSDSFSYTVSDGTDTATSTINVEVRDFAASTIAGALFFDTLENIVEFSQDPLNVAPVRNGMLDSDEVGLGSAAVRLVSAATDNVTDEAIDITTLTDLTGSYEFTAVAPGTYSLMFDIPESIIFGQNVAGSPAASSVSAGTMQVVIDSNGGVDASGLNFSLYGMNNSNLGFIDILASTHLDQNVSIDQMSDRGIQGGTVALNPDGTMSFFRARDGFDDVQFAELVLNEERDAALLTVIRDNGAVETARLGEDHFVAASNGQVVRFFGGIEDFEFAAADSDLVRAEFANYRDAIDQVLSTMDS